MRITSPQLARTMTLLAFAVPVMSSACSTESVARTAELDAAAADSGESGGSPGSDSAAADSGESDGTVNEDAQDGGFPPRECTAEIAAGGRHSCARAQDGRIWCWGSNEWGQLTGDDHGSGEDNTPPGVVVPAPREVQGLRSPATLVAAGSLHTCAAIDDGTVWCWGDNSSGQLGHGTFTQLEPFPVQVLGLEGGLLSMAMNGSQDRQQPWEDPIVVHHTCAVKVDGTVWCWGADSRGQLGDGKLHAEPAAEPQQVAALGTGAVQVSAGRLHACAVKESGRVWCWGYNVSGQVGNGTTSDVALPAEVPGIDDAIEVSAGGDHTCAVTAEGSVACWGKNTEGQCGVAGTPHYPPFIYQPTIVSGLWAEALRVAASGGSTCAVLEDGSVACWGSNCGGQLGNGSFGPEPYCSTATPGKVVGLQNAVLLASTGAHSCSATLADEIWCWGDNDKGELGDGTVTDLGVDVPWPVKVLPYCP